MGNNIQIFGRTFSDVSSITVNNTSSSAVKYVQEPIFEDITISPDYLVKQNTVISNGIIFQTDETYPGTSVVIDNAKYANIDNGDLEKNGIGIKIDLNKTYHCTGELKIEWSTGEQEIYSIDSDFTPTSYSDAGISLSFSWEGTGTSTQTFSDINLNFYSSVANGYKIFMRPGTVNVITKSGVLLDGSYYQISVTSDGFNTINLNLSDNPKFQAIYKSLAYRSTIASSAQGVSEWCNSLSSIKFQQFAGQHFSGNFVFNNVSFIDYYAFGSVYANIITGVTYYWNCSFPNCTTIRSGTFNYNTGITEVHFPQCSYIQDYTFSCCSALTTVSFPNCTSIGNYAFYYCRKLSSIDFSNCTTIGIQAFWHCTSLSKANLPNCTSIGNNAFQYCSALTVASFPNCTYIGDYTFYSCSALTVANLPNCTSIGNNAFQSCSNLTTISFPSCTSIGNLAFHNCSKLTTASFPSCTSIGYSAFLYCSSLTTASFPKCTFIGNSAFGYCSSLTTISFPECITIGGQAFSDCRNLTTASFSKCTSIGNYAFYYCTSLSQIYFMGNLIPSIGTNIFAYTPMSLSSYLGYFGSIYVPSSLLASYKTAINWSQYSARMVGV